MIIKENNKRDIEDKLSKMGDYVKIGYLTGLLKTTLDFDTRKFVLLRLSKIYEERGMLAEAAKLVCGAADINTTFDAKISDFMRAGELYIKAGDYFGAEKAFGSAGALGNEIQKKMVKEKKKECYKLVAYSFLKKDKRKHALDAFEKLLTLDLMPDEKRQVQKDMLELYNKLGKVREFYSLKKSMDGTNKF